MREIIFYCNSLHCLLLSKPHSGHEWESALTRAAVRADLSAPNIEENVEKNKLTKLSGFRSTLMYFLGMTVIFGENEAQRYSPLILNVSKNLEVNQSCAWIGHILIKRWCRSVYRSTTMTGGSDVWWRRAVRWASSPARSNWRTPACCRSRGWDRTDSAPGTHLKKKKKTLYTISITTDDPTFIETGQTWITIHPPGNVKLPEIDKNTAVSHVFLYVTTVSI